MPWNTGKGDGEADDELLEFETKHGPGRTLTPGEIAEIQTKDNLDIVQRHTFAEPILTGSGSPIDAPDARR